MEKHNKIAEKLKDFKNKLPKFFKKESFLLSIFVILCALTIIGTVALKKAKIAEKPSEKAKEELTLNVEENKGRPNDVMENSERVKNDEDVNTKEGKKEVNKESKSVSAPTKNEFIRPVEGKVVREYKKPLKDGNGQRFFSGITVSCKEGSDVKAAEAGKVVSIEEDATYGTVVTIAHNNGIKTVYSNLDSKINVKKDQTVKKGEVIGKVGKTAQGLALTLKSNGIKGSFCNIEMKESKDKKDVDVDPTKTLGFK